MRLAIILHSTIILTIWSGFKIFLKNKTKSKPFSNLNSILVCQMKTKKAKEVGAKTKHGNRGIAQV